MKNNNTKKFSWLNPTLQAMESGKYMKGEKGVFALKGIKSGELLAIFGGYIINISDIHKLPPELQDEGLTIHDNFVLNIIEKSELEDASHFNHNCNPNAGFRGQIFLVSMRDIEKGEEITFDYGMVLYRTKGIKPYKLKCLCGSKNCRGYITDNDWKILKLQKKYNGYFQYFLQEKINQLKKKQK